MRDYTAQELIDDADLRRKVREGELRDRFAMAALQGMLAGGYGGKAVLRAGLAYEWADAMLAARGKPEEP